MTNLTANFQASVDKRVQDQRTADAYKSILKALDEQRGMYTTFYKERAERQKEYKDAEESYQTARAAFNKHKPEGYKGHVFDGDSFRVKTLGAMLLNQDGERKKPYKGHYEVSRGNYISLEKMREHEATIMHNLARILPEKAEAVANVFYASLPDFVTPDSASRFASVKSNYYTGIGDWHKDYIELSAGSTTIKLVSTDLIDAQIDLVKRMMKSPDPLNPIPPRQPFSLRRTIVNFFTFNKGPK